MTFRPPAEPIRLTHCIGTARIGGAEKQLVELICRLPRDRFRQSLVLISAVGPLIDRVRAAGCEVVDLGKGIRRTGPRIWRSYGALARRLGRFVRHLRERRPHILHGQLYWANILSVAAGRLSGVPIIMTSRLDLGDEDRKSVV